MKQFLEAGRAVTTHGIHGELKIDVWCDEAESLCALKTLYLDEQGSRALEIVSGRPHKNMALIHFRGFDDIDTARKLINRTLYLNRDDLKLEDGVYFIDDILGLRVVDADNGKEYGTLAEVTSNGAHQIYHIAQPGGVVGLLPAVPEMVSAVDIAAGEIRIRPVKGLFDDAN